MTDRQTDRRGEGSRGHKNERKERTKIKKKGEGGRKEMKEKNGRLGWKGGRSLG